MSEPNDQKDSGKEQKNRGPAQNLEGGGHKQDGGGPRPEAPASPTSTTRDVEDQQKPR